jgi:methylglyoxal synthase
MSARPCQVRLKPHISVDAKGRSAVTRQQRRIAMVAHDNKKVELLAWADFNRLTLARHHLLATGTTGSMLEHELGLHVHQFLSGPIGGDQQIGARIAEGDVDMLIFFWDPLEPQPHDPDVRALLRLAVVWNVPVATNAATADFVISSPLFASGYRPRRPEIAPREQASGEAA